MWAAVFARAASLLESCEACADNVKNEISSVLTSGFRGTIN
jgi:hypothetical protein